MRNNPPHDSHQFLSTSTRFTAHLIIQISPTEENDLHLGLPLLAVETSQNQEQAKPGEGPEGR
jgi:hypothetical protein